MPRGPIQIAPSARFSVCVTRALANRESNAGSSGPELVVSDYSPPKRPRAESGRQANDCRRLISGEHRPTEGAS